MQHSQGLPRSLLVRRQYPVVAANSLTILAASPLSSCTNKTYLAYVLFPIFAMSPTGRPSKSPSFDFKEVPRQLQVFQQVDNNRQQLLEHLLQRVAELEGSLQTANSDLEDQTSIRRHWKTRAEDAEALLAQNQFVLALIDGNRYTFADSYFKDTETGGTDAATDLVGQIRSYIQERSLHEDPSGVSLMVHIFANKTAVSEALIDSGTISEPGQFDNFIAQFMRAHPFLYFVDCGSFAGAVDSKIKGSSAELHGVCL